MLDKIDELDLIDSTLADTLECISYYTGGLSMRKCYTLIDRDRLPEIQKDLKLGIRPNLGKTIVAYGEYKDYIIRKAKLENKIILELHIHDDKLLNTYNIGEDEKYRSLLAKLLSIHPELVGKKDITNEFISYAMNNIIPNPSGVIKVKNILFDKQLKGIVKYRVTIILIKVPLIIESISIISN